VLIEVNPPKPRHNVLKRRIANWIADFAKSHDSGFCELELGCVLDPTNTFFPDVAFLTKERAKALNLDEYFRGAPDLAVEIISPSDRQDDIDAKADAYLAAGTSIVWQLYPKRQYAVVIKPNVKSTTVNFDGALEGEDILPRFKLSLQELFADLDDKSTS
jgi:Uma2 family endonuclease